MPAGASGWLWRIVLDPRVPDGLADIRSGAWTFDDVVYAHALLDQLDARAAADRASV